MSVRALIPILIFLLATSLWATNGDRLIGIGAKSRGMGGVGVGLYHGAESLFENAATLFEVDSDALYAGATLFVPRVESDTGGGYVRSATGPSVIPGIAYAHKPDGDFGWGVVLSATAGMGVDYREVGGHWNMMTDLKLMQLGVPLVYRTEWFAIALTPVAYYGSLNIRYAGGSTPGRSTDTAAGYRVELYRHAGDWSAGGAYRSAVDLKYARQLSSAMSDFAGVPGFSDHLEQPWELAVGAAYAPGAHRVAVEYRKIGWGSARGYEAFGWEDQEVFSAGYEYRDQTWSLRLGINHAKSPISEQGAAGALANTLNLLAFPAIVETHYTAGGSLRVSEMRSVDLALGYAPEVRESYTGIVPGGRVTTRHAQFALTLGWTERF